MNLKREKPAPPKPLYPVAPSDPLTDEQKENAVWLVENDAGQIDMVYEEPGE